MRDTAPAVLAAHPDGDEAERPLLDEALENHGVSVDVVDVHYGSPADAAEWIRRVGDAEIVLAGWRVPDEALRSFPRVRAIIFLGTGAADCINLPLADELNIEVRTVHGYGDDSVAEHALALLLAAARRIPEHDAIVRSGRWGSLSGSLLHGKALGVVGLGRIGRRLAELGEAVGMSVTGWNRGAERGETVDPSGLPLAPLSEIMRRSDAVSVHLALTDDTRGKISAELIGSMRPGAILVNTARADVIDTEAALNSAAAGRLTFATDVFEPEPLPPQHRQRSADHTVMTPHVAFDTPEAAKALYAGAAAHLAELLSTED